MYPRIARLMLTGIIVVSTSSLTPAAAQSMFVTAGIGTSCRGSEGSVCVGQTGVLITTTGLELTERFVIAFRASRLDNAWSGETPYYGGPPTNSEVARIRHETGRTMRYGAEFLFHPAPPEPQRVSVFVGGGVGVRTSHVRTTCVSGTCAQAGAFDELLGTRRGYHRYLSGVAGVDVAIVRGFIARASARLDDFPSELGVAHVMIEFGYRFGKRARTPSAMRRSPRDERVDAQADR